MQHMIIAFVHHTAISEDTGEVKQDDIPKVMVEKKWVWLDKLTAFHNGAIYKQFITKKLIN